MNKQKPMLSIMFKMMTIIMSIRKKFRNIDEELSLAGTKPGDYILDFGCGLGFNTVPAAKIVGLKGKVFALDIHKQAIEIVSKKAKKYKLNNIKTIISNCGTGLRSNTIDIVYLHNTLPLIENKKEVLDEIYRVLNTNGILSYMSRFGSRLTGNNSMNGKQLRKYLEAENKFKLIKSRNGHFIFKKMDSHG